MNLDILIPTLNSEATIERALDSILHASKSTADMSFHVLIADGGSQDQTLNLINQFDKDLKVTIVSKLDNSPEEALSIAFNNAKAEYVMPMGSDDYLSNTYFSELVSFGILPRQILLPSNFICVRNNPIHHKTIAKTRNLRRGFLLRYTIPCPGLGWIAKTSDLKEFVKTRYHKLYSNKYIYATDNELFFSLIKSGWQYKYSNLNLSKYYFSVRGRSSSNRYLVSREACHIAQTNSQTFDLDIRLLYFLYRILILLKIIN